MDKGVSKLFGAFVLILIATALVPEIFTALTGMDNESGVPAWLVTALTAVIGAGILYLVWKSVDK